jgi:uncharacterized protein
VGPRFTLFAALFYGLLTALAALWAALRGFDLRLAGDSLALSLALGVATTIVTVPLGLLAYRLLPALRQIAGELGPRLVDGAQRGSLILVSVFSGVGEETFFRGAVQQEFGIVAASLLFGLVHVGPDRRYLLWTFWAVLAGFLFGGLYDLTDGLLAPILAHAAHNAATLLLWRRSREGVPGREPAGPYQEPEG